MSRKSVRMTVKDVAEQLQKLIDEGHGEAVVVSYVDVGEDVDHCHGVALVKEGDPNPYCKGGWWFKGEGTIVAIGPSLEYQHEWEVDQD